MIRCKFRCDSIEPAWEGATADRKAVLRAVHDPTVPEDEAFTRYTPSGELQVQINNPAALEQLKVGAYYYLDLTAVPATSEITP